MLRTIETGQLALPDQIIHFHRLPGQSSHSRKLLLLHGTGIDGLTTWGLLTHYLRQWDEILVPDLRGVGKTHHPDGIDRPFTAHEVMQDMQALVDHLGWQAFDLAGYSYGGSVAMLLKQAWPERVQAQFLLEAALLGGQDHTQLLASREPLDLAAEQILEAATMETGLQAFMQAIIPASTQQPARATWLEARLRERPHGVVYCIRCTNTFIRSVDLPRLLAAQSATTLLTGALSAPGTRQRAIDLALEYGWRAVTIEGADHGLPMQKPRTVAQVLNDAVAILTQPD